MDAPRVALVGGNCNNGRKAGAFYVNVNNAASNRNWNIGASPVFPRKNISISRIHNSSPHGENESTRGHLVGLFIILER